MYHAFNLDDALDKDNPENESNSKFSNDLSQDTLEGKGSSRIHLKFSPLSFLKKTKSKHPKILFYGHFSSIKNKFESVQEIIQNTFAIFLFNETKTDSFPSYQFSILEYRIFRKDRHAYGGGLPF